MFKRSRILLAASVSATLFLSACDSAEERAEAHYENAVELIAAGDVDRAIVELRNVFQLNGQHVEARRLYAQTMLDQGRIRDAFGSYTLVSEQLPEDLESRIRLARLAVELRDWDAFDRHVARALEIAPDDPETRPIALMKQFRDAIGSEDEPERDRVAEEIAVLVEQRPEDLLLRRSLIEHHLLAQRLSSALEEVEAAIAVEGTDRELERMRLSILLELGDEDRFESGLAEFVDTQPEDEEARESLIRWYLSRGETDKAEEMLRSDAASEAGTKEDRIRYIAFLRQTKGPDAARAGIETLLAEGRDTEILRSLRAGLDFDEGQQEEAISELEEIVETSEPSDTVRDIKVTLARLLSGTGNEVAARQRVEEVLAEDPTHVPALKMRAEWLIEQDSPDEAIAALRTALDQEPRDSEIMTLMAAAYLRAGNRELAGEMLSLAVDASDSAPDQTLRYARFLLEDGKINVAEPILVEALRRAPGNPGILAELGRVYLQQEDWPRLEQVEATLRRLEIEQATAAADGLRLDRLRRQQRSDEAVALLESIIEQQGTNGRAALEIVRTHLGNNETDKAEAYIDSVLAENPEDRLMRFLQASLYASTERPDQAEAVYRELLAENPQDEQVWRTLYTLLTREGRFEDARAALEEGLDAIPGAVNLQWALAGELEREGDIEGAIAIYDTLYEANSNSVIIANNLASLISTYREDEESLDRAWTIARRLRGIEQPAFQDTYGWIALRRGDVQEAISHLEPAAAALVNDPLVQYHLGMAYVEAERPEDALEQLRRAVDIAGPADSRPQFAAAREEIRRLESLQADKPTE